MLRILCWISGVDGRAVFAGYAAASVVLPARQSACHADGQAFGLCRPHAHCRTADNAAFEAAFAVAGAAFGMEVSDRIVP